MNIRQALTQDIPVILDFMRKLDIQDGEGDDFAATPENFAKLLNDGDGEAWVVDVDGTRKASLSFLKSCSPATDDHRSTFQNYT